jgi:leader peptidase (prepilin peptidase)/N-methyltransferase
VRAVLIALLTVVEVAIGWRIGLSAALPAYLFFGAVGWLVALSDASERRIPNAVLLPAYPIAAALLVVASAAEHQWYGLLRGAIGMLALATFYLFLALLRPGEMGFGDVKLAGLIGLVLGRLGWRVLILGAFAGPAIGAVAVAALLLVGSRSKRSRFPFAPFLVVGAVIAILAR